MSQDTLFGGIPDELPAGYGYADSGPATVHRNTETARSADAIPAPAAATAPPPGYNAPTQGRGALGGIASNPRAVPSGAAPPRVRIVPNAASKFRASGHHTTPTDTISMVARPTTQSIPSGVPQFGDTLAPDYGDPLSGSREARQGRRESRRSEKETRAAEKEAQVRREKEWQRAAQLGLRFDRPRGKWYRDVKITGVNIPGSSDKESRELLKVGSSGPLVREAQSLLAQRGFPCGTDGKFTETVKKQVAAFQKSVSLRVDGKIGSETWTALDPRGPKTDSGGDALFVRQYQDDAVAIMRGPIPTGAVRGAVLPVSKFPQIVAAIRDELEESYGDFPMENISPPPANWDFEKGKTKSGFTFDAGAFATELTKVGSRFKPSGAEASAYPDASALPTEMQPEPTGPNWLLIGGIAVGVVVVGGITWALWPSSKPPENPPRGA